MTKVQSNIGGPDKAVQGTIERRSIHLSLDQQRSSVQGPVNGCGRARSVDESIITTTYVTGLPVRLHNVG
jgi:hypothetical protein